MTNDTDPISDLSIHFPLTREDRIETESFEGIGLSIHFPLTREDPEHPETWNLHSLSIHFPLTREDPPRYIPTSIVFTFQSTSLSRGKTFALIVISDAFVLSIHFPLTREDRATAKDLGGREPFNPLPSHEGRPSSFTTIPYTLSFNPLPSHEGRRSFRRVKIHDQPFNPLPSHEGRPE